MRITIALAVALSVGLPGCMSILHGRSQTIEVETSRPAHPALG